MSLLRRVQPRLADDDDDDDDVEDVEDSSATASGLEANSSDESGESDDARDSEEDSEEDENEEEVEDDETGDPQAALSRISFGALARAQKSLSKEKARRATTRTRTSTNTVTPRERITSPAPGPSSSPRTQKAAAPKDLHRTSKHAPQELSSKRAVTRKRAVIAAPISAAAVPRDPRFDPAVQGSFSEASFRARYAFLDGYRADEMQLLRAELAKTKDPKAKERLQKRLTSMESRVLAQRNKDHEKSVLADHKRKERERVKQGKKAFYLKKSDLKQRVLADKYSRLSEKQVEKAIERKTKRKTQKERKNMPWARREA